MKICWGNENLELSRINLKWVFCFLELQIYVVKYVVFGYMRTKWCDTQFFMYCAFLQLSVSEELEPQLYINSDRTVVKKNYNLIVSIVVS